MTNLTDEKLIAAVAKKAGWTNLKQIPPNQWNVACWFGILPGDPDKGLRSEMPPWLTSVDEGLKLLDKSKRLKIVWKEELQEFRVQYADEPEVFIAESLELLPHAILLAWLEA